MWSNFAAPQSSLLREPTYHSVNASSHSHAVLTTTLHSTGNGQNATPHKDKTSLPIFIKVYKIDYIYKTNKYQQN